MTLELVTELAARGCLANDEVRRRLGSEERARAELARWREFGLPVVREGATLHWRPGPDVLSQPELKVALVQAGWSVPVEVHFLVDSSNDRLLAAAAVGDSTPRLCFAECQHAGRGRRQRRWVARFGEALQWSCLVDSGRALAQLPGLPLVVGVALVQALHGLGWREVGIKWPNDLVVGPAKLGGILVEAASSPGAGPGSAHAVIGIGLNLQRPSGLPADFEQPVAALGSLPCGRNRLAAQLAAAVLAAVDEFREDGLGPFLARYAHYDVLAGRPVLFETCAGIQRGEARGLADDGALRVQCDDGERRLYSADCSVRLA